MKKFIDLCAGIGGFHLALHRLNWKCVYASEIEKTAREVYEANFKKISPEIFLNNNFNDDIYKINPRTIPDFDVICAGFPCQPFSQIGKKKGFQESLEGRGNIFFELTRIIKHKRPSAFFLENVRHIINHDDGKTFQKIRKDLIALGYSFHFKVLKASDFNLPQHRPRTFMVGFRNETMQDSYFSFPNPQKLTTSMSDIFEAKCEREIGFTLRLGGMGSRIDDRRNWDSYRVDGKVVKLQPIHGKRMQGFPDDFYLPESRAKSLKLLGNSVAVDVVEAIGKQIDLYLDNKDSFKK